MFNKKIQPKITFCCIVILGSLKVGPFTKMTKEVAYYPEDQLSSGYYPSQVLHAIPWDDQRNRVKNFTNEKCLMYSF